MTNRNRPGIFGITLAYMGRKPESRRNSYGAWLYYLRTELDLSQEQVSKLTGIPRPTLKRWERTGLIPAREAIVRLAKVYRVPLEKLLRAEKVRQVKK